MEIKTTHLDVAYVAQPECKTIEVNVGGWVEKHAALHGGLRMLSLTLPVTLVGKKLPVTVSCDGPMELGKIVSRASWNEPLGMAVNENAQSKCLKTSNTLNTSVQWFATWRCNYKCSYCWQETTKDSYRKAKNANKSADQWVQALLRLAFDKVYISGGEPTLLPAMVDIVNGVGSVIPINMTSNLGNSFNVEQWVERVNPDHIDCITFSFHPTQTTWGKYCNKLRRFVSAFGGYKVGLELVMHPGQTQFEHNIRSIETELKLRTINIDPYHVQPAKFKPSPGETACLLPEDNPSIMKLSGQSSQKTQPTYCSAGVNRINVDPLGNVFTCMSAIDRSKMFGENALPHYKPLGNIFDQSFKPNTMPVLCWETFRCSACDSSVVGETWTPYSYPYKLPVPE